MNTNATVVHAFSMKEERLLAQTRSFLLSLSTFDSAFDDPHFFYGWPRGRQSSNTPTPETSVPAYSRIPPKKGYAVVCDTPSQIIAFARPLMFAHELRDMDVARSNESSDYRRP